MYKRQRDGWGSLFQPPLYFKEPQQPLYYLISYLLFPILGQDPYGAMNMVSVIMGIFFMGAVAYAIRKTFSVPYWTTWLLFISTPMFVLTFTFSNEMAVAMCFLALALACNVAHWRFGYVLSGFFCGLAFWAYLPIALLGPMFLGWVYFTPADLSSRERMVRVVRVSVTFFVTTMIIWSVFIMQVPRVFPFEEESTLQYKTAVLVYGSSPGVFLISVLTVLGYFTMRLRKAFFLLLGLLPVLFFPGVFSHKHLFICSFAIVVPAAIAVGRSRWWLRCVLLTTIGMWFLLSISPFGVYGPVQGADIFLPTNDGPCPTGAYWGFYRNAKRGVYQEQYADEIYSAERGIDALIASNGDEKMAGNFNHHFVIPYLFRLGRQDKKTQLRIGSRDEWPESGRFIIIRRSYIRSNGLSADMNHQMDEWLQSGKVRIVDIGDTEVFPVVIEVGHDVPENNERALGKRILFARHYGNYNGMVETKLISAAFNPLYWVPAGQTNNIPFSPVYSDTQFSAYTKPVPCASIWRLRFPNVLLPLT
jgi:hypothetical protein